MGHERINSYTENDPDGTLLVSHWICTMAVTGILRFVNQTPLHMLSENQATAETSTYGVEQYAYDYVRTLDNIKIADILSSHWSYRNV